MDDRRGESAGVKGGGVQSDGGWSEGDRRDVLMLRGGGEERAGKANHVWRRRPTVGVDGGDLGEASWDAGHVGGRDGGVVVIQTGGGAGGGSLQISKLEARAQGTSVSSFSELSSADVLRNSIGGNYSSALADPSS